MAENITETTKTEDVPVNNVNQTEAGVNQTSNIDGINETINTPAPGNTIIKLAEGQVELTPAELALRNKNITSPATISSGIQEGATAGPGVGKTEAPVDTTLKGQTEAAIQTNKQIEVATSDLAKQEKASIEAGKTEQETLIKKQQAEDYAAAKKQEAEQKARAAEMAALLEKTKIDNANILNKQLSTDIQYQQIEKEKNAIETERLKLEQEKAIKKANADVIVAEQQSAWAFNKMGLGFSSGIVLNAQKIATDGIATIANIQADYNYKQQTIGLANRQIDLKIGEIQQKYTNDIVTNNNTYAEKQMEVKNNLYDKITAIQNDQRKSKNERDKEINALLKEYRTDKINLQKNYISDIQKIKDKGLEYAKELQAIADKEEEKTIGKINNFISTGAWANKSEAEKAKLAKEAGYSSSDIQAMEDRSISNEIGTKVKEIMPDGFTPSFDQFNQIKEKIKQYTKMGYNIYDAANVATKDILGNTEEYKLKAAAEKAKLTPKSGGGAKAEKVTYTYKQKADGTLIRIPSDTGIAEPIVEYQEGKPSIGYDEQGKPFLNVGPEGIKYTEGGLIPVKGKTQSDNSFLSGFEL